MKTFFVLSHFHWDREWYQSFEEYRFRLVRAVDELLSIMERDPDYKYFHMDGQTVVLEDYLQIRPENRARLEKLIRDGRIVIGPWYVMPDEFLVSGESLVRNLQKGGHICRQYGVEPMHCYYVTDLFGHNTQSPQIALGFGLPCTALFRGIADYPKDTFVWEGADGSRILCWKLDRNYCYSTFYFAARRPFDGGEIETGPMLERIGRYIEYTRQAAVCDAVLSFDGCDHADPEPMTPTLLRQINEAFPDVTFVHETMDRYYQAFAAQAPALETIRGALYRSGQGGSNNFLLQNVLSSCVVLKQQNAACEQLLTRVCEPLDVYTALLCPPVRGRLRYAAVPRSDFFRRAWELLLQNQPHDSICGCSIGPVHQDNETRYRHVRQICSMVLDDEMLQLGDAMKTDAGGADGAFLLYNPAPEPVDGCTVFSLRVPEGTDPSFTMYDPEGRPVPFQILHREPDQRPVSRKLTLVTFRRETVLTVAAPIRLPAGGFAAYTYKAAQPVQADEVYNGTPVIRTCAPEGTMQTAPLCFDNGPLTVRFCPDGTLCVTDKATGLIYEKLLQLQDGGDVGDGYRYVAPEQDAVACGTNAALSVTADGPLAAEVRIETTVAGVTVRQTVVIRRNSRQVDVCADLDNTKENHRLRVLMPLPFAVKEFVTRLPYDMAVWPVRTPHNAGMADRDTGVNPAQGAVLLRHGPAAFAVYTQGLYEVEMKPELLYLTLMRSVTGEVGLLRGEYASMLRPLHLEYALDFTADLTPAAAYRRSDLFQNGLYSYACAAHDGPLTGV